MMAVIGCLRFAKKMWYAPLIWAITSGNLAFDYVRGSASAHLVITGIQTMQ